MPLYAVLIGFIAVDVGLFVATAALGLSLDGREAMLLHFALGLVTAIFTCFIHVLVLFYLIGTGKDIRDAVEDEPELRERYFPWTRDLKRRVFPPACFAVALVIVAALMGGEVHSRLLSVDGGKTLPFRGVPAWWVHAVAAGLAVLASAYAFRVEVAAARENRRGIEDLNRQLEAREAARSQPAA